MPNPGLGGCNPTGLSDNYPWVSTCRDESLLTGTEIRLDWGPRRLGSDTPCDYFYCLSNYRWLFSIHRWQNWTRPQGSPWSLCGGQSDQSKKIPRFFLHGLPGSRSCCPEAAHWCYWKSEQLFTIFLKKRSFPQFNDFDQILSHTNLSMHVFLCQDKVMLGTDYPFPLGELQPGTLIESMEEFDDTLKALNFSLSFHLIQLYWHQHQTLVSYWCRLTGYTMASTESLSYILAAYYFKSLNICK